MSEPQASSNRSQREQTINALCEHFAQDTLTVEEFERRVDLAHRADTVAELQALLADLPATPPVRVERPAPAPAPAPAPPPVSAEIPAAQTLVAIMGGVERKGRWVPARLTRLFAMMGGFELDFREAQLGPGITEIAVGCFMGGVEIIVAPDTVVETAGVAIMGGFSNQSQGIATAPDAPILRITGFALMGGVDIQVRLPGETAKDARRREREERKRLKKGRQ